MSASVRCSSRSVRSFIAHSLAQLPGPGKSAATICVLTPIDPVVPSNTTFLGFIKTVQDTCPAHILQCRKPMLGSRAFRDSSLARRYYPTVLGDNFANLRLRSLA